MQPYFNFMKPLHSRIALISSCVDLGTTSITHSLELRLKPSSTYYFRKGLRQLNIKQWLIFIKFLINEASKCDVIVAAFTPVLAIGIFSWFFPRSKKCAILEWNEYFHRSDQFIPFFSAYGLIYKWAFRQYTTLYTPSPRFADFYQTKGICFKPFYIPLPHATPRPPELTLNPIKVLFIGGDAKRKGGIELLSAWAIKKPVNASLTFVCPSPPIDGVAGVTYLRSVKSGTEHHSGLFAAHDILILPTYWDTFGYVLLEAAANGLCIVTTQNAGASAAAHFFGAYVLPTTKTAVDMLFVLLQSPGDIVARKAQTISMLPIYNNLVNSVIDDITDA